MSNYTVIGDVGDTLVSLLRDKMQGLINTSSDIVLSSPGEIETQQCRLCLFLYQIVENANLMNLGRQVVKTGTIQPAPLTLDLYYILTSFGVTSGDHVTESTIDSHKILGRAMQILYDYAILKGSILKGSLAGSEEELRVTLYRAPLEELTKLWNCFPGKLNKLSACYIVTPVKIDANRKAEDRRLPVRDGVNYQKKKSSNL